MLDALSGGELEQAAQLSGVSRSSLKGMLGHRLGGLHDSFGPGGFTYLEETMKAAPRSAFSGAGHYLDAFRPSVWHSMGRDVLEQARQVRPAWRSAVGTDLRSSAHTLATNVRHLPRFVASNVSPFEHELAEQLRETDGLVQGLSSRSLDVAKTALTVQTRRYYVNTTVGTVVDGLNHTRVFDGVKNWGERGAY